METFRTLRFLQVQLNLLIQRNEEGTGVKRGPVGNSMFPKAQQRLKGVRYAPYNQRLYFTFENRGFLQVLRSETRARRADSAELNEVEICHPVIPLFTITPFRIQSCSYLKASAGVTFDAE